MQKNFGSKIKNEISDSDKQGSYKQNRYLAIANVFHIFCTSNMRTLLCLENILAEEGKEKWDTTVLNGLLDSAKEDTDYRGDDIEIIVMNSKNFKNKKKEFKEKLNKHKRVIIISSYKTLAEGQNLQYNVKDTEGLIRLPGKRKGKEKDLDGIYLGEITYIIRRSIDSGQPFDRNERNKNISEQIFQAEDLFVQSEIGKTDKDKWIKEAFLGENKSKQYNLKSIGVSITRTVLQAVGRLCRTTLKSPDIYILVNENVLKKMRERFPDITVCQIKGLFDEKVREKYFGEGDIQLARLLFNSLRPYKSEIFHRNNIMGKLFYQSPKWKSKDTVYFVQIHLDYSFHLILKVVTFTKDTGDSGGYVFDKSTGNFRRALKTDKGTKYVKKNKNTKSTVPFLNIENMEKFEASKMGVLKQFVEDVRTYLRDYIEINFETMEEMMSHDKKWEKYSIKVKENKSKIYEKEAAKRLSSHKIAIVDECNTETSKKIADDFQAFLKKVYGVGSKLGDSVSSGTYNLRIIHDKGYYKGENDLHDEIFNKCIVQHITVENYKKCDLEKNPEFYAIIQELFIKEDIVNKQLTTFNWSETLGKSGKTWAFVSFKKDDTDKNTKKKDQYTYYRVFIAPDGKLSFDSCAGRSWMRRKDEWKNIIGYHQELIDKRKSEKRYDENIEGFFYTDINDICTIYKTNACVYPRFDDIEAELLLLKADKELDKEQMIDALLHFKEDSPELVKKNKEDFEKFLNNLKNKEEEYVDKKAFYKDIGRGKLREGFNEYLRAEYRILLNFSKSKENLPLYDLDAMTDIHYSISGDSSGELVKYFVGSAKALNGSVARSNPIRKIIGKTLKAEEILPMLTATFVRNEQYTVIPFPYKYIREYFQVS